MDLRWSGGAFLEPAKERSFKVKTFKSIGLVGWFLVALPCAAAQTFDFPGAAVDDPATLSKSMPGLAREVIAVYREDDRRTYLDNLFRLQIVAGQYADATRTLIELRALRTKSSTSPQSGATDVQYEIFARAKASQGQDGSSFDVGFQRAFRDVLGRLDDRTSALVMRALCVEETGGGSLAVDFSAMQRDVHDALQSLKGKSSIALPDALRLIRAYQVEEAYRSFKPLLPALIAEDDQRRYIVDRDVLVKTPDGAAVCVLAVRPRTATGRLPTLFEFTIYADPLTVMSEARRSASNGYVGVEGLTRGKGCSQDKPVPLEHDGSDAAAVIDWISRQPWSDGRVGMFGGSYNGFTQWAAAKHMPKALKALMPAVTVAPGIDMPMEGNIFQTFSYYWPFYIASGHDLDVTALNDRGRWNRLTHDWYLSGKSYRSLDALYGTPNPIWDRWVDHPSYDAYWQGMIPYRQEFARIDIPVLTTTGYYDGGQIGATYYFTEHHKYHPGAEHYLVIGPYDHIRGQRGTVGVLGENRNVLWGYEFDPAAQIDLGELRYQWFDYVFKGGPKPALLQDRVNYEVMGANVWRHAPSLEAMGGQTLRFHLGTERSGDTYPLSEQAPKGDAFITQALNLADRTDVDRIAVGGSIVDKQLDTWNSVELVSEPLAGSPELSGLFFGQLDFVANKKDLDLNIGLYELTPKGEYFELSWYLARASYIQDPSHRQLLTPGGRQRLAFKAERLTSRQFQPGSRLVVLLSLIRQPGTQLNYGTGKDVSDETIADAKEPLTVKWFGDSFIEVPVRR
jgi:putative CocE/NonD family hydrolase